MVVTDILYSLANDAAVRFSGGSSFLRIVFRIWALYRAIGHLLFHLVLGDNYYGRARAGGWWTFKYDKIEKSQADLWVLVLYRFSHRDFDFVIIEPEQLLERYKKLGHTSGIIQSYVWVTENGQCWETRGLGKAEQEAIADGSFEAPDRDFSQFL
ncbi:MAG: hypothetical protein WHX52_23090, partial [Anaerolineae bacterium]